MKKFLPLLLVALVIAGCKPRVDVEIGQKQEQKDYTQKDALMTQGTSKITIIPDRADLTFGLYQETRQLQDAVSKTKEIMNNVTAYAAKAGIPQSNIKIQDISMNKFTRNIYKYDEKGKRIFDRAETYYRLDQSFTITLTDISQYAKVFNDILALGVNKITGINFYSTKMDETKEKALVQAIEAAKKKAQIIADTSGLKINKLINVVEYDGDRSGYVTAPTITRAANNNSLGDAVASPAYAGESASYASYAPASVRSAYNDEADSVSSETIVPVTPAGTIDVYGRATLIYELK